MKSVRLGKGSAGILPEIELRPAAPAGLAKEPRYRSSDPQKFFRRFGDGEGKGVAFAVDEKKGPGKGYDCLIADLAGTGNLAKGKRLNGKVSSRGFSYLDTRFPPFTIKMPAPDGGFSLPLRARFSWHRGDPEDSSLYLTPLCVLEGTVVLGGEKRKMIVFDANCNGVFGEGAHGGAYVFLDYVVAKDHDDFIVAHEMFSQAERLGDAAFPFLVRIIEVPKSEVSAIAKQFQEIARVVASRNDHDLAHPGMNQGFDRIVDHGFVIDRQQVFVRDLGQRVKPRAKAAGKDDALHSLIHPFFPTSMGCRCHEGRCGTRRDDRSHRGRSGR